MTEPKKPLTGLTRTQFAKELGVGKSYITALGHQGRLVLHPDGSVDATATRAILASTVGAPERAAAPTQVFMDANDRKAHYQAETARLDYEERCGQLMKADKVRLIVAAAATSLRSRLEQLPDNLAPTLAAVLDENQIKATLANEIEAALSEMSHHFAKLASQSGASANQAVGGPA